MKRTLAQFCLLIMLFSTCTKDDRLIPIPSTVECSKSLFTFSTPLDGYFVWCDLVEDAAKNIVVVGENTIQRHTPDGKLEWKTNMSLPGQIQNIIQADGNNYFVTSATNTIESLGVYDLYNEGRPSGTLELSTYFDTRETREKNCEVGYNRIILNNGDVRQFRFMPTRPANKNTCTLSKIDETGKVLWQKNFPGNYYRGTSLCKADKGNIYLLTFIKSGRYRSAIFDKHGIFQDTIIAPYLTDNIFVLYKLSPEGDVIWERMIDKIFNNSVDYDLKINLASTSSSVFVQNRFELIGLNHAGNITRRAQAGPNCAYNMYGCLSRNDQVVITGYGPNPSYSGYYATYTDNGTETQADYDVPPLPRNAMFREAGDGFIFHTDEGVIKFNGRFEVMWSIYAFGSFNIHAAKGTCSGGVISVESKNNGYSLVKRDANGSL